MRAAVHAEWTKLRTVAGPGWLLVLAAVSTVALGGLVVWAQPCPTCVVDPAKLSLTGVQLGQAVVAMLAVTAIGGEYGTGLLGTTLMAMPRRGSLLVAKGLVVIGPVMVAGAVGVICSLLAGRMLLPGSGMSLAEAPVVRAGAGSVLYLALIALLSLGFAAAVRSSAGAIGIVLGLLYLLPILITVVTNPDWKRHLRQIAPSDAGLAIQVTRNIDGLPIGPWAGLGVLALWAAGALLVGGFLFRLRDA
jgi:ABC-2 type transport system permease protein